MRRLNELKKSLRKPKMKIKKREILTKAVCFKLPQSLLDKLKRIAKASKCTLSNVVREALEREIK